MKSYVPLNIFWNGLGLTPIKMLPILYIFFNWSNLNGVAWMSLRELVKKVILNQNMLVYNCRDFTHLLKWPTTLKYCAVQRISSVIANFVRLLYLSTCILHSIHMLRMVVKPLLSLLRATTHFPKSPIIPSHTHLSFVDCEAGWYKNKKSIYSIVSLSSVKSADAVITTG